MSISYFCNNCENEDNFIVIQGVVHCDVCQSNDIEIVTSLGDFAEDVFYDDLDNLFDIQQVGISSLKAINIINKTSNYPTARLLVHSFGIMIINNRKLKEPKT